MIRQFEIAFEKRWHRLKQLLQEAFATDLFSVNSAANVQNTFQGWLDSALENTIPGPWIGAYVRQAYKGDGSRANLLVEMANTEVQGIIDAFRQQAVRVFMNGLLMNQKPREIVRIIVDRIQTVGVARSKMLADFIVTKARSEGHLDMLQALGHTHVGIIPEKVHVVADLNPYHKGKGAGGGQFTSAQNAGFASSGKLISKTERNTVFDYLSGSNHVNLILRKNGEMNDHQLDTIKNLDSIINRHNLVSDANFYRFVDEKVNFNKLKKGQIIHQPAYMSTSKDLSVAKDFSESRVGSIMEIFAKKGTIAFDVQHSFLEKKYDFPDWMTNRLHEVIKEMSVAEKEVIFPRSVRLMYLGKKKKKGFFGKNIHQFELVQ